MLSAGYLNEMKMELNASREFRVVCINKSTIERWI